MNRTNKDKLLRALRLIERITRPERETGHANTDLLSAILHVHEVAETTLEGGGK